VYWFQEGELVAKTPVAYDATKQRVFFPITPRLEGEKVSYLEIVNVPKAGFDPGPSNDQQQVEDVLGADGSSVNIRQPNGGRNREERKEFVLLRIDFRTSKYATFADKVMALKSAPDGTGTYGRPLGIVDRDKNGIATHTYTGVKSLTARFKAIEAFDQYDLEGKQNKHMKYEPLVRARVNPDQTGGDWFSTLIQPNFYDLFPGTLPSNTAIRRRDTDPNNPIPLGATEIRQVNLQKVPELNVAVISSHQMSVKPSTVVVDYSFPYEIYRDHAEVRQQVVNYSLYNDLTPRQQQYLDWIIPALEPGTYSTELVYVLPGQTLPEASSAGTLDFLYNTTNLKK